MRSILLFFGIIASSLVLAGSKYQTTIFDQNIKTLQILPNSEKLSLPIIELNGDDILNISFDELSHEAHSYGYKLIHCNGDWSPSNLMTTEYIEGYTTGNITEYQLSQNTSFFYTHYKFNLPNDEMKLKISGNYVVLIYEDNQTDRPIAQACFSVVEPKVNISATIRGNTDSELNNRLQQIDFDIQLKSHTISDINSELKVYVRQNNRLDNQVSDLQPTFISGSKLSYINNKALIFEGGNEFYRFDISSIYAASEGINDIKYIQPHYEVFLTENKVQNTNIYMHNFDVNGKFVVNYQEVFDDSNYEADYMYVNFSLAAPKPFFTGQLYLGGEFNYNQFDAISRLKYDNENERYYQRILLKQGGYNFQYRFVPKGSTKAFVEPVDGSYWETENEYTIYVYQRPIGERYDRLIAVKNFNK
jgi:hypothetical protein